MVGDALIIASSPVVLMPGLSISNTGLDVELTFQVMDDAILEGVEEIVVMVISSDNNFRPRFPPVFNLSIIDNDSKTSVNFLMLFLVLDTMILKTLHVSYLYFQCQLQYSALLKVL